MDIWTVTNKNMWYLIQGLLTKISRMEIFTANISTGETYRLTYVHLSMILDDGAPMVQRLFSIQIETERWIYKYPLMNLGTL